MILTASAAIHLFTLNMWTNSLTKEFFKKVVSEIIEHAKLPSEPMVKFQNVQNKGDN